MRIVARAREKNIVVQEADRVKLDHISGITTHQGVVAYLGQKDYCTVDDMLEAARSRGEAPFLILCDEIADPHNLGAILRTAEVAGAHGVIAVSYTHLAFGCCCPTPLRRGAMRLICEKKRR